MRRSRFRLVLLLAITALSFLPSQEASACEICKYAFFLGYVPCRPVTGEEVGATICTGSYSAWTGYSCQESGTFCSNISVGGGGGSGGGSGGGGGGGGGCTGGGFCPAECFSCNGGGSN